MSENSTRRAIRAYQEYMRIGEVIHISGLNFRRAYPLRPGYKTHEEVFLNDSPGANYGAWTVEYKRVGDLYEIQRNELSHRRVFVAPEYRHKYLMNPEGFWEAIL